MESLENPIRRSYELETMLQEGIKLRAWVKDKKEMHPVKVLCSQGVILENGEIKNLSQVVLMQSIGSLDRLGRLIYEGDLIEIFPKSVTRRDSVYFNLETPRIVRWNLDEGLWEPRMTKYADPRIGGHPIDRKWENIRTGGRIVGNIYQNNITIPH